MHRHVHSRAGVWFVYENVPGMEMLHEFGVPGDQGRPICKAAGYAPTAALSASLEQTASVDRNLCPG